MRKKVIDRIIFILCCNGGSTAVTMNEMNLNTNRFLCVYKRYIELDKKDDCYQHPKRYKGELMLSTSDLERLSDCALLDLYEMVVRRANVCM